MTVDCCTPSYLDRDQHSGVADYACSAPSSNVLHHKAHMNGTSLPSSSLKRSVAAQTDVAELDSSRQGGGKEAVEQCNGQREEQVALSSGVSRDADADEPLLSPNEERFVMYPVRRVYAHSSNAL